MEYFYLDASGNLIHGTDYAAGELYKTTTWDENTATWQENSTNNNSLDRTVEFKDKLGLVVLAVSYNGTDAFSTYYVYDDFGLLRMVIPPKAADDTNVNSTELSDLCYQYKYDEQKRLIEKKLPGAGWEYLIFDSRDRLVLSQDAKLRAVNANQYHYTMYDSFNRPAEQGICTESLSYTPGVSSSLRNAVKASTNYTPATRTTPLVYTYYDDYNYQTTWGGQTSFSVFNTYANVYTNQTKTTAVRGLVTGVKTRVLGTSTWLYTVNYYDKYERTLQQFQSNPDGGYNRISTAYNFNSQPIKTQVYHKKTSGSTAITTEDVYTYDHMGRMLTTTDSYNGATAVTIASNTYDEIGRLKLKEMNNGYQDVNYTYNIRGWLTKINDPDGSYSSNKLFSEELYYDSTGELVNLDDYSQFNGNISGIRWKNFQTDGTSTRGAYAYTYDGLNRLTKGDFGAPPESGNVATATKYELNNVSYDKNGNITALTRLNSGGGTKENLTYAYANNIGNQLTSLSGTYNGVVVAGKSFSYDANGNATADNLRSITVQYFNELDLPKKYTNTAGTQYTLYEYDATGNKWSKTAYNAGTTTMEYYGNFVYQNGTLDRVLTSEGYYQGGKYYYYLKDHLGNTRMAISYNGSTPTVEQTSEYYPFGSMFTQNNLSKNKYLYNGKELNNEFFENYDYGARFYDAELGRWHSVDPLAEKFSAYTPYNYCLNNPVSLKDHDGEEPITAIIDAITAFTVEAGMSYVENLVLNDMDATTAFENIRWGDAGIEAAKSYGLSFIVSGLGSSKALAKAANSKLGKLTLEFTGNVVADIMKQYNKGAFDDKNGNFSFEKLMNADFTGIMQGAIVEALVSQGFSGKAEQLESKFVKAQDNVYKQQSKLLKSLQKGSSQEVISRRLNKVNNAQKNMLKQGGKAAAVSTASETTGKTTNKIIEETTN